MYMESGSSSEDETLSWYGATRQKPPAVVPNAQMEASKIVADVRSGLASGATKVVILSNNPSAITIASLELTLDELAHVDFAGR